MRLGTHVKVSGGKDKAFDIAMKLNCETMQIFIRSVRSWNSGALKPKDIDKFLSKKADVGQKIFPLMSHNSYLINLATNDAEKREKSYIAMMDEIIKAEQLQLDYIIIHPGVVPKKVINQSIKDGLDNCSLQLNKLFKETKDSNIKILLETTAGQGTGLGSKFQHLASIIEEIENKKRIGVCFDTAHAFGAGYDFTTKKRYEKVFDEFFDIIGLQYLLAFHLNDSIADLGSKKDRHDHIGQGKIGVKPFGFILNDERFKNIPGILETPKSDDLKLDIMNLKTLRSLIIE